LGNRPIIPRRWPPAACRCHHAPRLKHFRFPKVGAELCAELPVTNFLSDPGRRCIDLYSTSLGMLHLLLCPPSRFIPLFLAEHPQRRTFTACLRGDLHCHRGKTVAGRPNIAGQALSDSPSGWAWRMLFERGLNSAFPVQHWVLYHPSREQGRLSQRPQPEQSVKPSSSMAADIGQIRRYHRSGMNQHLARSGDRP
jgi:hypothetical protein